MKKRYFTDTRIKFFDEKASNENKTFDAYLILHELKWHSPETWLQGNYVPIDAFNCEAVSEHALETMEKFLKALTEKIDISQQTPNSANERELRRFFHENPIKTILCLANTKYRKEFLSLVVIQDKEPLDLLMRCHSLITLSVLKTPVFWKLYIEEKTEVFYEIPTEPNDDSEAAWPTFDELLFKTIPSLFLSEPIILSILLQPEIQIALKREAKPFSKWGYHFRNLCCQAFYSLAKSYFENNPIPTTNLFDNNELDKVKGYTLQKEETFLSGLLYILENDLISSNNILLSRVKHNLDNFYSEYLHNEKYELSSFVIERLKQAYQLCNEQLEEHQLHTAVTLTI